MFGDNNFGVEFVIFNKSFDEFLILIYMTVDSLKEKISRAKSLLESYKVADAFSILEDIATEDCNYKIADRLKHVKQTYRYMIHYMTEGIEDTSRPDVYRQTLDTLYQICEDILIDKFMIGSPEIFFSTSRICRHRKLTFPVLWNSLMEAEAKLQLAASADVGMADIIAEKDQIMRQIFDLVWTARNATDLCKDIADKILNPHTDPRLSSYLISAVVLSLLEYYDTSKVNLLLDIYDSTELDRLGAVSLVGIVLILQRHSDRILNDRRICRRLELWQDSLITYSRLRVVIKEIIRTRDTDRVSAKMRDEVIPELMKLRPDMLKKMRDSAIDFETGMFENNPEWEELLEKNGIADKMRELTEMQSDGADLMMVTFSNLKGFPFFNSVSSWFLPFDIMNPVVKFPKDKLQPFETILSMGQSMCDSDKYSLMLAFASMPEMQRQMMFGQLEQQMSQIMEEAKEKLEKQSNPEFSTATTIFIRDLYRFYKLFRKREEFSDPFKDPLNFMELPVISSMIGDIDMVTLIGEFYFKRGYYDEALDLFHTMEGSAGAEASYWEKVGYALQSLKRYSEAADAYQKASLLSDPGQWLLRNIAYVNKKLGKYGIAAQYYSRALENDPDNVTLIMNAGNSYLDNGDIGRALQSYYHANYLLPDDSKIWRAIAWGELINGDPDKSSVFYDKVLNKAPVAVDFLNAGHAKLAAGRIKDAIELYEKSSEKDWNVFELTFNADQDTLLKLGIDILTQRLIIDAIKLRSEK